MRRARTRARNGVAFMLLLDGAFGPNELVGMQKSDIVDGSGSVVPEIDLAQEDEWKKIQKKLRVKRLKKTLDSWYENHVEKGDRSGRISRHALVGVQIYIWRSANQFSSHQMAKLIGKKSGWLQKVEDGKLDIGMKNLWKLCEESAKLKGYVHGILPPMQVSTIFEWAERYADLIELGRWEVHSDTSASNDLMGKRLFSFVRSVGLHYGRSNDIACPTCETKLYSKDVEKVKSKFLPLPSPPAPQDARKHIQIVRDDITYCVPVSERVQELVDKWIEFSASWNESDYLFPARTGKRSMARNTLWQHWDNYKYKRITGECSLRDVRNLALAHRWLADPNYERFSSYARVGDGRCRWLIGEIHKIYSQELKEITNE